MNEIIAKLAIVYIENSKEKISDMTVEEYTTLFQKVYQQINSHFTPDVNKGLEEFNNAFRN